MVLPMYMGVIPRTNVAIVVAVLPMYMGVIPSASALSLRICGAPHVYGGDPVSRPQSH